MEELDDNLDSNSVDSSPSVNELHDEYHNAAIAAQTAAEDWADENDIEEWSNGDQRTNYKGNIENTYSPDQDSGQPAEGEPSPEKNQEQTAEVDNSPENNQEQPAEGELPRVEQAQEDLVQQIDEIENSERAELEEIVQQEAAVLNEKFRCLSDQIEACEKAAMESNNVEDRDYYNDLRYEFASQRDVVKSLILENQNRLTT